MKRGARRVAMVGWAALASVMYARPVVLRDGTRIDAKVEGVSLGGVHLAPETTGGPARVVSWDMVKSVEGAEDAASYVQTGDSLWRARTRLERGDVRAAEALAERLSEVYSAEGGPSAALAAECLVRCRMARGAQGAAVGAWLWWARVQEGRGKDTWIGGGTALGALSDGTLGLGVHMPPIWAPGPVASSAAASTDWSKARSGGGVSAALAELYEKAARFEAGLDSEVTLTDAAKGEGLAFAREIVLARGGDSDARQAARTALEQRLAVYEVVREEGRSKEPARPRWVEAWCRMALGRSMLREQDERVKMQGVLHLMHVAARFGHDFPGLAALALAESAVTMESLGDHEGAASVKGELERMYPGDPVRGWDELRRIGSGKGTGKSIGQGSEAGTGSRNSKGPA